MIPVIRTRGLGKGYGSATAQVIALREVDLDIAAGELLAVMGPSGCGKSTLLHLLGCLDRPTTGAYHLDGRDVATLSDEQRSRVRGSKIGFVFQAFNLIPECDVLENVALPFLYGETSSDEATARARAAIERVGLTRRTSHRPAELSGGERQRVAIARAIVTDPRVILADEPTGNLDSSTSAAILDLFQELHAQGRTIVVVTHDEEVARRCQRVVRLQDGRVISDGAAA